MAMKARSGKAIGLLLVLTIAMVTVSYSASAPKYMVDYRAKGTRSGMRVTISTPNGTEVHLVGASYVAPTFIFQAGQHAYISAQNLGEQGTITVMLYYSRLHSPQKQEPVKMESSRTGGGSIATVSWLVGDERAPSGSPQ